MRTELLALVLLVACGDDEKADPCAGADCAPGLCVASGASARCSCPPDYEPRGLTCFPVGGDSDSDTDTGTGECEDADGDGHPALACGGTDCDDDDDLVHPFAPESGEWTVETVDVTPMFGGGIVSIAAAGDGVHICYVDDADVLHVASRVEGVWTIDDGLGGTGPAGACSIAADETTVHVAFERGREPTVEVVLLTGTPGGAWSEEVLDVSDSAPGPAIDLDTDGGAHVVYRVACEMRYRRERDGWASPPHYVNPDVCGAFVPAIDVEHWGNARLSWVSGDGHVWVADNQGGWLATDMGPSGGAETAVLNLGDTHLAYVGAGGVVTYDWQVDGVWQGGVGFEVGWQVSMARDSSNRAHLVYRGDRSTPMYVSPPSGHSYQTTIEDTGAESPDLAAGDDGLHVAWKSGDGIVHAERAFADGVDSNCDGHDGVDFDGDGHASFETWGDDCDDRDAAVQDCE